MNNGLQFLGGQEYPPEELNKIFNEIKKSAMWIAGQKKSVWEITNTSMTGVEGVR